MMQLCHGWGWPQSQTTFYIHIRHIKSVWAHYYAVHRHMEAALHSYTYPTWLRFWGSGSLVKAKWCDYVMFEADSHLKLLHISILDNDGNNSSSTRAKMPAHWWQRWPPHCYEGNNVSLMTMPSQQGQQLPATMGKMPAHQQQQCNEEQQSPSQQWWRGLRINGNDAITARATTPALQWAMRAKMIHNLTTAETPAHQQQQWCHHNNGKDACINKHAYHDTNSAAELLRRMRNRFSCVCCSGAGRRLIWNWLCGDQSPLNQFHLNSFPSFCPSNLPLSLVSSFQNCPH